MAPVDWRKLYAANQATIARSGIPVTKKVPLAPPTARRQSLPAVAPAAGRALPKSGHRALVHVPPRLDALTPAPLLCMLHGCTQDPSTFAAATLMNDAADREGFVVVYPGQDRGMNPQGCWNWFLPAHQGRNAGEPAAIARIVRDLIEPNSKCTIDPGRVFVAGLSSGGAMAAILAACYPDLFAAVAVHSGLAYGSATDLASAFAVMARGGGDADAQGLAAHLAMGAKARPVPSLVIHGSADRTVVPANAIDVLRQSMTANHLAAPERCDHDVARPTTSCRGQVEGGYGYTRSRWTGDRGALTDGPGALPGDREAFPGDRGVLMHELLEIDQLGHAWSGGVAGGSYTDPRGPSATEAICTFFALTAFNAAPG